MGCTQGIGSLVAKPAKGMQIFEGKKKLGTGEVANGLDRNWGDREISRKKPEE